MAKENDIKEELLKQMDKDPDKMPEANIKSPKEIIAKDTARVKRLKWITIFSWLLVIVCFIAAAFLERARNSNALIDTEHVWLNSLIVILQTLLLIAVIFTISLYVRWRTLTIHKIQARLANIEMLLQKMSRDK
jgi:hypothetical protein